MHQYPKENEKWSNFWPLLCRSIAPFSAIAPRAFPGPTYSSAPALSRTRSILQDPHKLFARDSADVSTLATVRLFFSRFSDENKRGMNISPSHQSGNLWSTLRTWRSYYCLHHHQGFFTSNKAVTSTTEYEPLEKVVGMFLRSTYVISSSLLVWLRNQEWAIKVIDNFSLQGFYVTLLFYLQISNYLTNKLLKNGSIKLQRTTRISKSRWTKANERFHACMYSDF